MNEKALFVYLAKILANQSSIQGFLALVHSHGDEAKRAELNEHFSSMNLQYLKVLAPALLEGANLDWDPNDLLNF